MNASINILCPLHGFQILFIDINSNTPLGKRALCYRCSNLNRPKTIQEALDQAVAEKQKELMSINQFKEQINNQLFGLRKSLIEFKVLTNDQVEQFIIKINNLLQNLQQELFEEQQWQFNLNERLTLKDLQLIGQNLSQLNSKVKVANNFESAHKKLAEFEIEKKSETIKQIKKLFSEMSHDLLSEEYLLVQKIIEEEGRLAISQMNDFVALGQQNSLSIYSQKNSKLHKLQKIQLVDEITSLCFFRAYTDVLIMGFDTGKLEIWKLEQEKWLLEQQMQEHNSTVTSIIAETPNSSLIITSSFDRKIIIWSKQLKSNWLILQRLENHFGQVNSISLTNNNALLASGSDDKQIIIWKQNENLVWTMQQTIQKAHDNFVDSVCFIGTSILVSQSKNGEIKIWKRNNMEEFSLLNQISLTRSKYGYYYYHSLYYNQQLGYLYCHRCEEIVVFRVSEQGVIIKQQQVFEGGILCGFHVSNDGKYMVIYDENKEQLELYKLK